MKFLSVAILLLSSTALPAPASIIGISKALGALRAPPASLLPGQLTSNNFIFLFLERRGVTLTSPLSVDITQPGLYTMKSQIVGGQISAGTVINSYYFHANPTSGKATFTDQELLFSTEETIVGVMVTRTTLNAGVPVIGAPSTTYDLTDPATGLHFPTGGQDSIQISDDSHTLILNEVTSPRSITEVRVLTRIN